MTSYINRLSLTRNHHWELFYCIILIYIQLEKQNSDNVNKSGNLVILNHICYLNNNYKLLLERIALILMKKHTWQIPLHFKLKQILRIITMLISVASK